MMLIRVGFVGAGANTRRYHIPKLRAQPGVELVAVANRTKASGDRVALELGIPRVYADWRELVRAPDLDAICIGTWPNTHSEITRAALEHGNVYIFGTEGTLRIERDAKRLSGGRRGDTALREIPVPAGQRIGWRVEEEFVNAIRGHEKISRTTFQEGVRYLEFTEAVWKSAADGRTVAVAEL